MLLTEWKEEDALKIRKDAVMRQSKFLALSAAFAVFVMVSSTVAAESWPCGDPVLSAVTATLEDETLTISGTGRMTDFHINEAGRVNAPWGPVNYDKIIIGENITYIGIGAFARLGSPLSSVSCLSTTPPTLGIEAFLGRAREGASLYVPQGHENAYRNANVWGNFGYINPSTVKFDSQGGNPVDSQKVTYGGKVTRPEDPTRDGYIFKEWYAFVHADGPGMPFLWNFDTDTVKYWDITFNATWEKSTSVTAPRVSRTKPFGISQNGANLRIVGASQATPIRIYNLNGKLLMSRSAMPNELISVSHLARGTYVVKALGNNVKFVVR